ncbi:MAG: methyltransferase domain-containing protein [Phycisphaerae bacterium]|nr:methyltransferase domain-containing protein [Phycisphaerae bacterium]
MNPLKTVAKRLLSDRDYVRLGDWVFHLGKPLRFLWYRGSKHFCPCCGAHLRRFLFLGAYGYCPCCWALGRHRLLGLYLERKGLLEEQLKMLEIAPMRCSRDLFAIRPNIEYTSADLVSDRALVRMDITSIDLPDNQFDAIICYHVLEHIPEDRKAMREICRILKPGGWAIIDVPQNLNRAMTFEDPGIVSPAERKKHFGTEQHVRLYGRDYVDRLRECGFEVVADSFASTLTPGEIDRYGIWLNEADTTGFVHFCRKARVRDDSRY